MCYHSRINDILFSIQHAVKILLYYLLRRINFFCMQKVRFQIGLLYLDLQFAKFDSNCRQQMTRYIGGYCQ